MLILSNIILWVLVLVLLAVILALVRQVGILYERVSPAGTMRSTAGLKIGEELPVLDMMTLDNSPFRLGGRNSREKSTLLFFLAPTCPVCKSLLPVLHAIRNSEADWLEVVLAGDGDREEHKAWLEAQEMKSWLYVLSPQLGMTLQVAQLPFAALLDESGILQASNPVNSRKHIEQILEAKTQSAAPVDDDVKTNLQQLDTA